MALNAQLVLSLRRKEDVLWARQEVKRFCASGPFKMEDVERIGVVVAELCNNMVTHARGGRLFVNQIERDGRHGIQMIALDRGLGIRNLDLALTAGFSTAGSFGDGLPTVRELVDKFEITTRLGQETRIEVEKWAD